MLFFNIYFSAIPQNSVKRVLFAGWINGSFVLLHVFMKQTRKTPAREIEKAKRELADIQERSVDDA